MLPCGPIAALTNSIIGIVKFGAGRFYDSVMFHTVIKPFGKSPESDEFLVKRIKGPGVGDSDYFYRIGIPEVLMTLHLELEKELLDIFNDMATSLIRLPVQKYQKLVKNVVTPLGNVNPENKTLNETTRKHLSQLKGKVEQRRKALPKLVENENFASTLKRLRLHPQELYKALELCTAHVQQYVERRIFVEQFRSSSVLMNEFWVNHQLSRYGL